MLIKRFPSLNLPLNLPFNKKKVKLWFIKLSVALARNIKLSSYFVSVVLRMRERLNFPIASAGFNGIQARYVDNIFISFALNYRIFTVSLCLL